MPVPFSFGAATTAIPLSQLDSNFNTPITLGNTAIQLGNTVTTLNNMTLANVTISSGNVTITNVTVTTANATTVNTTTLIATTANVTTGNVTNLISGNVTLTGGSITGTTISGSTGSFTTLTTSSTVTLNGGTANGVAYLNGSKVLTSGSALVFDGTNLGVGVSAANYTNYKNLAIAGTTGANIDLISGSTIVGNIYNTSTDVVIQNSTSGPMRFSINGSEQMRLTSTGLGIGTSSPQARLHINSGAGSTQFRMGPNSTSSDRALINYNSTTNRFTIDMSGNDAVVVDGSGNLGLGVTPSAWNSSWRALQIGSVSNFVNNGSGNTTDIWHNGYVDTGGNVRYLTTASASFYRLEGNTFKWFTAPSGTAGDPITFTQAMTLDASGNLGIGNTSPASYNSAADNLVIGTSGSNGMTIVSGSTSSGYIMFADGTTGQQAYEGQITYDHTNNFMAFNTSATERARITSGGYFKASNDGTYVGSTASYHELRVTGAAGDWNTIFANATATAANAYGIRVSYTGSAPNGTGNAFLNCDDTGATRFVARSNGGLANYSANDVNLSDRREKTNFAPAKSYLDTICAIPVQTFNYIDQSEDDPGLTLGVVAQDVQAVAPELVMESNWGTEDNPKMRLSIYQTDLQYALMKALQELKSELDSVKAELATLKGA
jgi:hypothetical protein